jgi:hypothetical protein
MKCFLFILKVIIAVFAIVFEIINFMLNNNPEDLKPAIVKWLRFLVSEENLPSFLYSIHGSEQIPFFVYIHKTIVIILVVYFFYFILKKVKNYSVVRCLYCWLFQFISSIKHIKEPVFISLHDGIAKIIEQLDVKQLCEYYQLNEHTIYLYLTYERFSSFELFVILTLIRQEKLILYGHKIIDTGYNQINTTHLLLQKIPKSLFITCDIYSEKSWSDNYNKIYNNIHGRYKYTNVSMKCEELDSFIKQHKSTNLLTSKHIA